jgi:hypothetical protein
LKTTISPPIEEWNMQHRKVTQETPLISGVEAAFQRHE